MYSLFKKKLYNALLHGTETYTYYWKKKNNKKKTRNTDLCNYMITYKTTDKTEHYMEYLRFRSPLKLLSYLHSFVLSIKRKRRKGGWFNFSGRVCVTKGNRCKPTNLKREKFPLFEKAIKELQCGGD